MPYKGRHGKSSPQKALSGADILFEDELKVFFGYLQKLSVTNGNCRVFSARRWLLICDLLLRTGLRASELCSLRLQDTPSIQGRNEIYVYRGKNKKDRRIPISQRLADEIARYCREVRSKTLPRRIRRSDTSRPLLYNIQKKPYTRGGIYFIVRTVAKKAGLQKNVRPHMFRHTYATRAIKNKKVEITELKKLMGHYNISTTEIYVSFDDESFNQLGERLDDGFDFGGEST